MLFRSERSEPVVEADILDDEVVELMTVYGNVAMALITPLILLVHANTDQVRHDFREAVVVIAFHPDYFDVALWIGKFADVA